MKTRSLLIIFMLIHQLVAGQSVSEQIEQLITQMASLEQRSDSLNTCYQKMEKGTRELEEKLSRMYLDELKDMENSISQAFDKTDVISVSAAYQEVIKSIISLHNEITQINNFSDAEKVFGIDFSDQLTDVMESALTSAWVADSLMQVESDLKIHRSRLRMMIRSFMQNPVISGLLRSNPVTSVAHSVINQALLYQQNNLQASRIDRAGYCLPESYKDFRSQYSVFRSSYHNSRINASIPSPQAYSMKSIEKMTKDLKPFIQLFDDLAEINEKYASSLHVFMKASEQTSLRVIPLEKAFYSKLESGSREEARQKINDFFNVGSDPGLALLEERLNDPGMKKLLLFSQEVDKGLLLLKNDFLKIITLEIELSNEYIHFFSKLKEGNSGLPALVNSQEVEQKIAQFELLRSSLENQKKKLEEIK